MVLLQILSVFALAITQIPWFSAFLPSTKTIQVFGVWAEINQDNGQTKAKAFQNEFAEKVDEPQSEESGIQAAESPPQLKKIIRDDAVNVANMLATTSLDSFNREKENNLKLIRDVLEQIKDGESCISTATNIGQGTLYALSPHRTQAVREAVLFDEAAQRLWNLLRAESRDPSSFSINEGHFVRVISSVSEPISGIFRVKMASNGKYKLEGINDKSFGIEELIKTPNPIEVLLIDVATKNSWGDLEDDDADLYGQVHAFAVDHGLEDAVSAARKQKGKNSAVIEGLRQLPWFNIFTALRKLTDASIPKAAKKNKIGRPSLDISAKDPILSASAARDAYEVLAIIVRFHNLPGCLPLTHNSLMSQKSLILADWLEAHSETAQSVNDLNDPKSVRTVAGALGKMHGNGTFKQFSGISTSGTVCMQSAYFHFGLFESEASKNTCFKSWKRMRDPPVSSAMSIRSIKASEFSKEVCNSDKKNKSFQKSKTVPMGLLEACNYSCTIKTTLRNHFKGSHRKVHQTKFKLNNYDLQIGNVVRLFARFESRLIKNLDSLSAQYMDLLEALQVSVGRYQPQEISLILETSNNNETKDGSSSAESLLERSRFKKLLSRKNKSGPTEITSPTNSLLFSNLLSQNIISLLSIVEITKGVMTQGENSLSNYHYLASSLVSELRNIVDSATGGLANTKKQRQMAKQSQIFSAVYRYLTCGTFGELLPPNFAPFASQSMQIEESKKTPFDMVVSGLGGELFSEAKYDRATKGLKDLVSKFVKIFTPCIKIQTNADSAISKDLNTTAFIQKFKKRGMKLLSKRRGNSRRNKSGSSSEMCTVGSAPQIFAKLQVVLWALGPSKLTPIGDPLSAQPDAFAIARAHFASILFTQGFTIAELAIGIINRGCENGNFLRLDGYAIFGKEKGYQISLKALKGKFYQALKFASLQIDYRRAAAEEWITPLQAAQELATLCSVNKDKIDLTNRSEIIDHYQCKELQNQGVRFLAAVTGKQEYDLSSETVQKAFDFLKEINRVEQKDSISELVSLYQSTHSQLKEHATQIKDWNNKMKSLPCAWKTSPEAWQMMLLNATKTKRHEVHYDKEYIPSVALSCPAETPITPEMIFQSQKLSPASSCDTDTASCEALQYQLS